jgi:hypothetical protein
MEANIPSTIKSLHALSVGNANFQVHPVLWTSDHLTLVGCRFEETHGANDAENVEAHATNRETYYATRLATSPVQKMKRHYVSSLFCGTGLLEVVRYVTYALTARP